MPLDQWSDRNEAINALGRAIRQGTHGRIRELSLDLTDDSLVVVRGVSCTYYGVQLAIHATQQFVAAHSLHSRTRLLVSIDGSPLELVVANPPHEDARETLSTHDAERRPQLTMKASA